MLDRVGGPRGLDSILEEFGDDMTRMERREPELNDWAPRARPVAQHDDALIARAASAGVAALR